MLMKELSFINFLSFGSFGIDAKEPMQSGIIYHVSSSSSMDSAPVHIFIIETLYHTHKYIYAPAICT